MDLKSPYPYFGGKRKIASEVWNRFGRISNYVEPFFGSGAVLLARPQELEGITETVNDLNGFISNFWRALAADPEAVAQHADWPVNENDLHARHSWLVGQKQSMQARLEGDAWFYDVKVAGWWVWGMSLWIGSGFCDGSGPWRVVEQDGVRQLVHLGNDGRGVIRQLVHLGNDGQGVIRKLVHLGNDGQGVDDQATVLPKREDLRAYFRALAERMRRVRVACGDWARVTGPSVTYKHGLTGVFLDPPYGEAANRATVYTVDSHTVSQDVLQWCRENQDNPLLRIALCGYEDEYVDKLPGWEMVSWNAGMGYGGQAAQRTGNGKLERVWFSPHCQKNDRQEVLFK